MTFIANHPHCIPDLIATSKSSFVTTKSTDTALASPPLTPTDTTCLTRADAPKLDDSLLTATAEAAAAAVAEAAATAAKLSLEAAAAATANHDKPMGTLSLSRTSPWPLPPVIRSVRPRRTHAKFTDVMEDKEIAQSIAAQSRSRYRKLQPQSRSSSSSGPRAPIEGTVQLNVFEQYRIDPKPLLQPAAVPSPVIREPVLPSQPQSDPLVWHGQNDPEPFSPSPSPPPQLPSMPSSPPMPQQQHQQYQQYQQHQQHLQHQQHQQQQQPESHRPKQHYSTDRIGRTSSISELGSSNTLSSIFEVTDDQLESHLMRETSPQPDTSVLSIRKPKISWKGSPLHISNLRCYETLHPTEALIASTLRLTPILYLKCRHTLLLAARDHAKRSVPFRKSDAQKLCRVDVNKTSRLWEIFGEIGWLGREWPGL